MTHLCSWVVFVCYHFKVKVPYHAILHDFILSLLLHFGSFCTQFLCYNIHAFSDCVYIIMWGSETYYLHTNRAWIIYSLYAYLMFSKDLHKSSLGWNSKVVLTVYSCAFTRMKYKNTPKYYQYVKRCQCTMKMDSSVMFSCDTSLRKKSKKSLWFLTCFIHVWKWSC